MTHESTVQAGLAIVGVFEGGGIKGLGLAGAAAAALDRGRRFQRVIGTSAGALVGSLIAAGYTGSELRAIVGEVRWEHLLDPPLLSRIPRIGPHFAMLRWNGIYRGRRLEQTWARLLAAKGVHIFDDLPRRGLRVVATDLTNTKAMVLPDDLPGYGIDAGSFSVARSVQMSAAVPFAFRTVPLRQPDGRIVQVADGALAARFPVQLADFEAGLPVVGFRLVSIREPAIQHQIRGPLSLAAAVISAGMGARETLPNLCSGLRRVVHVPMDHDSLDFGITRAKALELFEAGYRAGADFFDAVDTGALAFTDDRPGEARPSVGA